MRTHLAARISFVVAIMVGRIALAQTSLGTSEVEPKKAGEIRGDQKPQQSLQPTPSILRGVVVDSNGTPLPDVNVSFWYGPNAPEPSVFSANSDYRGVFAVHFLRSGTVTTMASHVTQLDAVNGISTEFPVLEGHAFDLVDGTDREVRIVVQPRPMRVLVGKTVDDGGTPIHAIVALVLGEVRVSSLESQGDGGFLSRNLPDDPYFLEVTAPHYQARVLIPGIDFKEGDQNLTITLKKGPFPIGTSIWEAVTGHPATKEDVAKTPLHEVIRRREWQYFDQAMPERPATLEKTARSVQAPPIHEMRMLVTDKAGIPFKHVVIESLSTPELGKSPLLSPLPSAQQAYNADDGVYQIPAQYCCVVSAPGTARVLVRPWGYDSAMLRKIILRKPGSIEFNINDASGAPIANAPVYLIDAAWEGDANRASTLLKIADERGGVTFTDVDPGAHFFAVGNYKQTMQTVTVVLKPGEKRKVPIVLVVSKGSQNPRVLMQQWREAQQPQLGISGEVDKEWTAEVRALPEQTRRGLAAVVRDSLPVLCCEECFSTGLERERNLVLQLEAIVGEHGVVKELKKDLELIGRRPNTGQMSSRDLEAQLAQAIARTEGDKTVPFFESMAKNTAMSSSTRLGGLLALSTIGSDSSVAAYARLRDAAYEKPGAPPRRASYTHAERMYEAAVMTLFKIPNERNIETIAAMTDEVSASATVSADYQTARMHMFSRDFTFKRLGAEWVMSSVTPAYRNKI